MEEQSNWRTAWQVDQNKQDLNISKNKGRNKESEVFSIMNFEFLWSFQYYEFWIFMKFSVLWILNFYEMCFCKVFVFSGSTGTASDVIADAQERV